MKKKAVALFTLALFIIVAGGSALAADTPKPIVVKDEVTVKATVEAIDHANRTVSLKGPEGNVMDFVVDEAVTRFNSMKVGDVITARYYESVAYEIQKPGTRAEPDSLTDTGGKISGEKPGGKIMSQAVTTVTVEAIDLATPAVTVKTSDGATVSFRVRKKKYLDGVKVGDQVKITETAALMIAVDAK